MTYAPACKVKLTFVSTTSGNCDAKERAIECYKQGIDQLQKGIEIDCNKQGIVD